MRSVEQPRSVSAGSPTRKKAAPRAAAWATCWAATLIIAAVVRLVLVYRVPGLLSKVMGIAFVIVSLLLSVLLFRVAAALRYYGSSPAGSESAHRSVYSSLLSLFRVSGILLLGGMLVGFIAIMIGMLHSG
jgi:hypothetical protein